RSGGLGAGAARGNGGGGVPGGGGGGGGAGGVAGRGGGGRLGGCESGGGGGGGGGASGEPGGAGGGAGVCRRGDGGRGGGAGGGRRRVQLLRVLVGEPNVLLLDEPTNDLDVDTLTELEDLLDRWAGSLVVVSHDRYFLERVTDHVVALLGDGRLSFLGGGVDEYLERRSARGRTGTVAGLAPRDGPRSGAGVARDRRMAKKELQRLERQIDRLGVREEELTGELAARASDYAALIEL